MPLCGGGLTWTFAVQSTCPVGISVKSILPASFLEYRDQRPCAVDYGAEAPARHSPYYYGTLYPGWQVILSNFSSDFSLTFRNTGDAIPGDNALYDSRGVVTVPQSSRAYARYSAVSHFRRFIGLHV
jgi:hypothetical protein